MRSVRYAEATRAELRGRDLLAASNQGWAWKVPGVWDLLPEWFIRVREPAFEVDVLGLWPDPNPVTALPEEQGLLWEVVKRACREKGMPPPAVTDWRLVSDICNLLHFLLQSVTTVTPISQETR